MTRSVLVPSSLAREAEDKREATRKLGYVARAATVFRVDRLVVFPDPEGETGDGGFVETVLRYAATPPYLRKAVWDRRDELEFAGVLPPLRVAPQTGSGSNGSGSLRQGIVTEVGPDERVRVNCGLQHPVSLPAPPDVELREGERVTVRVSSRRPVRAKLVDEPPPGFVVAREDLSEALARPDAGVCIAASRHGTELTVARLDRLVECIDDRGVTVAFGAPERGLPAVLGVDPADVAATPTGGDPGGDAVDAEGPSADVADAADERETESAIEPATEPDPPAGFDLWLDTVPDQGSEVVRTEEAMFATLAPLNLR